MLVDSLLNSADELSNQDFGCSGDYLYLANCDLSGS